MQSRVANNVFKQRTKRMQTNNSQSVQSATNNSNTPRPRVRYLTLHNSKGVVVGYATLGMLAFEKQASASVYFCSSKDFFKKKRAFSQVMSSLTDSFEDEFHNISVDADLRTGVSEQNNFKKVLERAAEVKNAPSWFKKSVKNGRYIPCLIGSNRVVVDLHGNHIKQS